MDIFLIHNSIKHMRINKYIIYYSGLNINVVLENVMRKANFKNKGIRRNIEYFLSTISRCFKSLWKQGELTNGYNTLREKWKNEFVFKMSTNKSKVMLNCFTERDVQLQGLECDR